ncbi:MAG: glutamine--fructose-6-phosphate aminotransferase [Spirochaetes bacterium GWF1_51_8]|nr:MAG: glutamine--fructose-6-phosphate aminotransferase [Spirochaetes bacterium GWF1_51_8]
MCGIVGYIGNRDAKEIILDSLQRLEYRGYDSAGIAMIDEKNAMIVRKEVGRIDNLRNEVFKYHRDVNSKLAIGHTRWATHGKVTAPNAHPHCDSRKRFAVVHNGIIENYQVLRKILIDKGHTFSSETDSEVLVHLIEEFYKEEERNLQSAVVEALKLVEGTYGIAVICVEEPYKIVGARNGSPLVLGIGENEMFIASDVNAIMPYTKNVVYLEDKEVVVIKSEQFKTYTLDYQRIEKEVTVVDWDVAAISKGDFETFMLKEIFEQPEALGNALRGRVQPRDGVVKFGGLTMTPEHARSIDKIIITACGTSWHASLVGKYLIERFAEIPVEVDYASEFRYRNPILNDRNMVVVISQSGETADTLEALREAKRKGAKVIGITNVIGSTIAKESDGGIYLHAGPEIGVASTKAFSNQLMTLAMLAIYIGRLKNLPLYEGERLLDELMTIPYKIQQVLNQAETIQKIALKYVKNKNFLYLGRGFNFPIALEGALKLKEISYIHAEGYPAAEMKHGPIALIDENMPVVFIAPKDSLYEKIMSNIEEVKARSGRVIVVTDNHDSVMESKADDLIFVPGTIEEFSPMINIIPLQLIAYYIAYEKGLDVDKPRNLAKSVTVE